MSFLSYDCVELRTEPLLLKVIFFLGDSKKSLERTFVLFRGRFKGGGGGVRKRRVLVLNSYPDPPLSEILYSPLLSLMLCLPRVASLSF